MIKRSGDISRLSLIVSFLVLTTACQEFDRLRLILKPEQFPEGLSGPHRVSIRAVPTDGTTLELNGRSIPLTETTELRGLRAGEHRLILRAPGYESFASPMTLGAVSHLDLEVHLQPSTSAQEADSMIRGIDSSNGPHLSDGVHPASISIRCASNEPPTIDGALIEGAQLLQRAYGILVCGGVRLRYQYTLDGELELGPLSANLEVNGDTLKPGESILASQGLHTFLLPRQGQPLFPIEIQVKR